MSYLRAGVFAEGPTDYFFLMKLVDRMLPELAYGLRGHAIVDDSMGIDAPRGRHLARRADRIAAAIDDAWDRCTLFVIRETSTSSLVQTPRSRACAASRNFVGSRSSSPGPWRRPRGSADFDHFAGTLISPRSIFAASSATRALISGEIAVACGPSLT